MKPLLLITSNADKLRDYQAIIKYPIETRSLDLPELQGTPEDIVKEKARVACELTGRACFVDDTSLGFDEWNGLPGPYIKDFLHIMGNEKLANVLLSSTKNHKAVAMTSIGYCAPGKDPVCVQGLMRGTITLPRGDIGFKKGWSEIFVPEGHSRTYAEMPHEERYTCSQRTEAIRKFEKFLENILKKDLKNDQ